MKRNKRIRSTLIAIGIIAAVYGVGVWTDPPLATKAGLDCPPMPFPVTIGATGDPEVDIILEDFADHITQQFEEVYLRFCWYLDSLQDTVWVADSTIVDSVYIGDSAIIDNCTEYVRDVLACDSTIRFDANAFYWVDDTAGSDGDVIGDRIEFIFGYKVGSGDLISQEITWSWKADATTSNQTWLWPDVLGSQGSQAQVQWSNNSSTLTGTFDYYDFMYIHTGSRFVYPTISDAGHAGTTWVTIFDDGPNYQVDPGYKVFLSAGNVQSGFPTGDPASWYSTMYTQTFDDLDSFAIIHTDTDTGWVDWITIGDRNF